MIARFVQFGAKGPGRKIGAKGLWVVTVKFQVQYRFNSACCVPKKDTLLATMFLAGLQACSRKAINQQY